MRFRNILELWSFWCGEYRKKFQFTRKCNIYKEIKNNELSVGLSDAINQNSKVQLVFLAGVDNNSEQLKTDLEKLGWEKWKDFKSKKDKSSTLYGLMRANEANGESLQKP